MTLTKEQIIERMCKLSTEVARHFEYRHAADCVCGVDEPVHFGAFRNTGESIDFIEAATRAAIKGTPIQQNLLDEVEDLKDRLESLLKKARP